jgi:hypothetical protein
MLILQEVMFFVNLKNRCKVHLKVLQLFNLFNVQDPISTINIHEGGH